MSPLDYCLAVQKGVNKAKPEDPNLHNDKIGWFGDTGQASNAVTLALEGKTSQALRIAEPLADKYFILA